jgi:hypothetical protein
VRISQVALTNSERCKKDWWENETIGDKRARQDRPTAVSLISEASPRRRSLGKHSNHPHAAQHRTRFQPSLPVDDFDPQLWNFVNKSGTHITRVVGERPEAQREEVQILSLVPLGIAAFSVSKIRKEMTVPETQGGRLAETDFTFLTNEGGLSRSLSIEASRLQSARREWVSESERACGLDSRVAIAPARRAAR